MDRNGEHLQKLGAVSVSSACDLGFAGQTRHDNWDAVLNMQGDSTAFALREEVLLAGDIIHLAPGGIGTIEEILVVLAQNKVGMADKTIILVGKEYWAGQISQFLGSTSKGNIKPHHLKKVFVVDTPDEAKYILEKIDKDKKFLDQRIDKWDKATKAELTQQELLTYK